MHLTVVVFTGFNLCRRRHQVPSSWYGHSLRYFHSIRGIIIIINKPQRMHQHHRWELRQSPASTSSSNGRSSVLVITRGDWYYYGGSWWHDWRDLGGVRTYPWTKRSPSSANHISLKDTRIGQVMNHKAEEEDAVIGINWLSHGFYFSGTIKTYQWPLSAQVCIYSVSRSSSAGWSIVQGTGPGFSWNTQVPLLMI